LALQPALPGICNQTLLEFMTETLNTWAIHAMNSFKSADGTLLKVDLSVDHVVAVRSNCSGILTQRQTGDFLKAIEQRSTSWQGIFRFQNGIQQNARTWRIYFQ